MLTELDWKIDIKKHMILTTLFLYVLLIKKCVDDVICNKIRKKSANKWKTVAK